MTVRALGTLRARIRRERRRFGSAIDDLTAVVPVLRRQVDLYSEALGPELPVRAEVRQLEAARVAGP